MRNRPKNNLVGQTFYRLTAIEEVQITTRHENKVWRWRCNCSCGSEALVNVYDLLRGHTRSCGCWKKEQSILRFTTHGESRRSNLMYFRWKNFRHRKLTTLSFKEFVAQQSSKLITKEN